VDIERSTMDSTIHLKNELYANLSADVREELARHEQTLTVARGTILVRCGVPSDQLIILNSGTAEISVPVSGKALSLGVAGPGKVLALHSVISGDPPHTDVACLQDCEVVVLPRKSFLGVLQRYPQMYIAIAKVLSGDLALADEKIRDHGRTVKSRSRPTSFTPE
jgi:CRP-like cAMP-binding protein